MTEGTPRKESLVAEVPFIGMDTSFIDVLTKRSAFNPFPEKTEKGLLVAFGNTNQMNPTYSIRYPATFDSYTVSLPISQPISSFPKPQPGGDPFIRPHQMHSLQAEWPFISDLIIDREIQKADTRGILGNGFLKTDASGVPQTTDRDEPLFAETAGEVYGNIVKSIKFLLAEGGWREAIKITRGGIDLKVYEAGGRQFNGDALHDYISDEVNQADTVGYTRSFADLIEVVALLRGLQVDPELTQEGKNKIAIHLKEKKNFWDENDKSIKENSPDYYAGFVQTYSKFGINIPAFEHMIATDVPRELAKYSELFELIGLGKQDSEKKE